MTFGDKRKAESVNTFIQMQTNNRNNFKVAHAQKHFKTYRSFRLFDSFAWQRLLAPTFAIGLQQSLTRTLC